MQFTPIDLAAWPRGQMFWYFSQMAPTGYSMTTKVDITGLRPALKRRGIKFFPAYLWLVTKCLNEQIEFKVAYQDKTLGYYDTLTPLYASLHDDDKTFSLMWTAFDDDLFAFCEAYRQNQIQYGDVHGVLSQPSTPPPPNAYTVSTLPWVSFEHFAVHSYENKPYFFPSVEAGKIIEDNGHEYLPLSLTCHHATTDGYHCSLFFTRLNEEIEKLKNL